MSNCTVTLTANAGVVLEWRSHVIWVDALHAGGALGFPAVSSALWRQMRNALPPPELLCFTHCHPDHYSFSLASEARALWPTAGIALPRRDFDGQILHTGERIRLSCGGITLEFLRLPHEGPDNGDAPHYGLLLSDGAFRILIPGDCETASPSLARYLEGAVIDLAILNFPWLTLRRGCRYLEEILRPRHVLLVHLPSPGDDANGYLEAARRMAEAADLADVRLLTRPLQREAI